jgi:hypothetical protein
MLRLCISLMMAPFAELHTAAMQKLEADERSPSRRERTYVRFYPSRLATSACVATSMHVFTSTAVMHHSGASARPMYAPSEHRQCCRQTTGCDVRITQSGRTAAQAGPTSGGNGRNGCTGTNGTSIVDHIIAAHAHASMASTMVRHDWTIH